MHEFCLWSTVYFVSSQAISEHQWQICIPSHQELSDIVRTGCIRYAKTKSDTSGCIKHGASQSNCLYFCLYPISLRILTNSILHNFQQAWKESYGRQIIVSAALCSLINKKNFDQGSFTYNFIHLKIGRISHRLASGCMHLVLIFLLVLSSWQSHVLWGPFIAWQSLTRGLYAMMLSMLVSWSMGVFLEVIPASTCIDVTVKCITVPR